MWMLEEITAAVSLVGKGQVTRWDAPCHGRGRLDQDVGIMTGHPGIVED